MSDEKLGKLLLFVIGFLILITSAVIVGSFFFESPKKDEDKKPEIVQLKLDDPIVTNAYFLITTGSKMRPYKYVTNYSSSQMMPTTIGDEAKLYMTYKYLKNNSQIVERNVAACDELSGYQFGNTELSVTCNSLGLEGFKAAGWKIFDINYDTLFTSYQKIFGTLVEMPKVSFAVSDSEYCYYSETNLNYLCFTYQQELEVLKKDYSKIVSVSNTEDTIKIVDVYAYCEVNLTPDPINPSQNVHSGHKCYVNNEKLSLLKEIPEGETIDVGSFGVKYLHTFQRGSNGEYYFVSSELYQGE